MDVQANLVYQELKTDENKQRLKTALRNLLSLLRRCQNNQNFKIEITSNLKVLDHEIKPQGSKILNRFKQNFNNLIKPCLLSDTLPRSRQLKILSGPCSFVYFPIVIEDMRLLILGEKHDMDSICQEHPDVQEVQNWLWDLAKDAPECLDLFVETFYREPPDFANLGDFKTNVAPLASIRSIFEDCSMNNKECPKALRYHFVDIRSFHEKDTAYVDLLNLVLNHVKLDTEKLQEFYTKWGKNINNVRDYILGFTNDHKDETREFMQDLFFHTYPQQTIHQHVIQSLMHEIEFIRKAIRRQLKKSILFMPQVQEVIVKYAKETFQTHILNIISRAMDIFLLARLFSQFDKNKMHRGPSFCQSLEFRKVKNAIIYCGDDHQSFITFFIEQYFHIKPAHSSFCNFDDVTNQCMAFDIPFDFFRPRPIKESQTPILIHD